MAIKLTGNKMEAAYPRYAIVGEGDLAEGVATPASLDRTMAEAPRQVVRLAGSGTWGRGA